MDKPPAKADKGWKPMIVLVAIALLDVTGAAGLITIGAKEKCAKEGGVYVNIRSNAQCIDPERLRSNDRF